MALIDLGVLWLLVWLAKNAAMDVTYALRGAPNPRYEVRKAKARAAGQAAPNQPVRYGTRDYFADLLSDGLQARTEARRARAETRRREQTEPTEPTEPTEQTEPTSAGGGGRAAVDTEPADDRPGGRPFIPPEPTVVHDDDTYVVPPSPAVRCVRCRTVACGPGQTRSDGSRLCSGCLTETGHAFFTSPEWQQALLDAGRQHEVNAWCHGVHPGPAELKGAVAAFSARHTASRRTATSHTEISEPAGGAADPEFDQVPRAQESAADGPSAQIIPFPPITPPQEDTTVTTTNGEVVGLDQSIAYAKSLGRFAGEHGSAGNEGYIGHLSKSKVAGAGLATAHEMQEAFGTAAAAADKHAAELEKQKTVQEAYDLAPDAGDKDYQQQGR